MSTKKYGYPPSSLDSSNGILFYSMNDIMSFASISVNESFENDRHPNAYRLKTLLSNYFINSYIE